MHISVLSSYVEKVVRGFLQMFQYPRSMDTAFLFFKLSFNILTIPKSGLLCVKLSTIR